MDWRTEIYNRDKTIKKLEDKYTFGGVRFLPDCNSFCIIAFQPYRHIRFEERSYLRVIAIPPAFFDDDDELHKKLVEANLVS